MEPEGVSLPLIHEHLMVHRCHVGRVDCCRRFNSINDGFYCKICRFVVHRKCSESPEFIKHPSHPDHTLQLQRHPLSLNARPVCKLCALTVRQELIYRCEICDFNVDLYCAKYPPPEVIEVSKTHGHKLTLLKKWSMFNCGAKCGKTQYGFPYKCDECGLTFHIDCVWRPEEANDDEQMINWAELRQTLASMQENIQAAIQNSMQELTTAVLQKHKQYHVSDVPVDEEHPGNIQAKIQNSIQELTAAVLQQQERCHVSGDDVTVNELDHITEGIVRTGSGVCLHGDHEDIRWESRFKLDIPEFHGNVKGEEILDWLVVVEEILEFKEVPGDRKVALVATKFRGKAAIWWFQIKATRRRAGKEKVKSWEKLQKLLRKGFLPYKFDQTMYNRLQNLGQGDRSVDDYADEFSLLITRNEIFDTELQLVSRFIGGLRPIIRSAMTQFEPTTVAKAHARAVAFEQELKSSSSAWSTDTNRGSGPFANSYSEKFAQWKRRVLNKKVVGCW